MNKPKCKTCSTDLVKGFIPDNLQSLTYHSKWYKGDAEPADTVLFMQPPGIKDVSPSEGIDINAYRCPSCGLLELYAIELSDEEP